MAGGLLGGIVGASVGALLALVVATLVNANCDSVLEQAEGCTRLHVGAVVNAGAGIGAFIGLLFFGWLAARRHQRRP